jgi:hypothetical protein
VAEAGTKKNRINDTRQLETAFKQAIPGIEKRLNSLGIS